VRPDIVISGAGVACAVGTGCDALWEALQAGRDGLRGVERFPVNEFNTRVAGLWPQWDHTKPEACTALELATAAAREAWRKAKVDGTRRVAVIVGTCFGEQYTGFSELAQNVGKAIGATGPCVTVSTACSSSTTAIGLGRDLIEEGVADVVIAGGVDVLTRQVFAGFHALGTLSTGKCAPFGDPPGMTLGEGAGFVVLEANASGLTPMARVLGYGLSGDAHHETSPDPSGSGVVRAIRSALADAQLDGTTIDYVSAHGTGTDSNDAAEWLAVRTAFPHQPLISSTKSFFGHAQGAAGVIEVAALLLCLQHGTVPPTLRAKPPRAGAPSDAVADGKPRAVKVRHAVKLSAAFGGANSALVLGEQPWQRQQLERRPVYVAGLGTVSALGLDVPSLVAAFERGQPLEGAVTGLDLRELVRSAPVRDVDLSAQFATAAAALALADAKINVRGPLRDRTGLFSGNTQMPAKSVDACVSSMDKRGILGIAAVPFTHMVLNAPAGLAAKLLSLKGPLLVLSAGRSSGLLAILRAAQHLSMRRCADVIVAGGIDERPVKDPGITAEGAAFAALTCEPRDVVLEGWGTAGPNDPATAIARAGCGPVDFTFDCSFAGSAEAASSAFAFLLAAARIRSGTARRVLVVSASDSLSCAAVLAAPGA